MQTVYGLWLRTSAASGRGSPLLYRGSFQFSSATSGHPLLCYVTIQRATRVRWPRHFLFSIYPTFLITLMNLCYSYSIKWRYEFIHVKSGIVTFGGSKRVHSEAMVVNLLLSLLSMKTIRCFGLSLISTLIQLLVSVYRQIVVRILLLLRILTKTVKVCCF